MEDLLLMWKSYLNLSLRRGLQVALDGREELFLDSGGDGGTALFYLKEVKLSTITGKRFKAHLPRVLFPAPVPLA